MKKLLALGLMLFIIPLALAQTVPPEIDSMFKQQGALPKGWTYSDGKITTTTGGVYTYAGQGGAFGAWKQTISETPTHTATETITFTDSGTVFTANDKTYKEQGTTKYLTKDSSIATTYEYKEDGSRTKLFTENTVNSYAVAKTGVDKDKKTIYSSIQTGSITTLTGFNSQGDAQTSVYFKNAQGAPIVIQRGTQGGATMYFSVDQTGKETPISPEQARTQLEASNEAALKATVTDEGQRKKLAKEQADKQLKEAGVEMWKTYGSSGLCSKGFGTCAAVFMKAYDQYTGWARLTTLLWSDYGEWAEKNRATIQKALCDTMLIPTRGCITSKICAFTMPIQADNTLVGVGPTGEPTATATVTAERTPPVTVNGLTGGQLNDILGSNTIIVGGTAYSTDNAPQPLTLWRYKIHYSLTNILDKDLQYNIVFKGPDRTASYYPNDKTLPQRRGTRGDISKYSATKYDKVCLTLNPGIPTHNRQTATTNIMPFGSYAPTLTKELCQPITEYQAVPVTITQETFEDQKEEYIAPPSTATNTNTETEETTTQPEPGGNI